MNFNFDSTIFLSSLSGIGLFCVHFVLTFTLPLLLLHFFKDQNKNNWFFISSILSCFVPTFIFWSYYNSAELGYWVSWAHLIFCVFAWAFSSLRNKMWAVLKVDEFLTPILVFFLIGVFFISIVYLFEPQTVLLRFKLPGSDDNLIQKLLTDYLKNGSSPFNLILDHYPTTIADRPPLIASFYLTSPFRMILPAQIDFVIGTIIPNLFWIPLLWALLSHFQINRQKKILMLFFFSLNGFFFYYSVFTWGKMLAGSLALASLLFLILEPENENRKARYKEVILAALGVGFAGFSHGGSLFIIIPMTFYFLWPKNFIGFKKIFLGVLVTLTLFLPWAYLKSIYEPEAPGLTRFALTDSENPQIFSYRIGLLEALKMTYSKTSLSQIFYDKIDNLKALYDEPSRSTFFENLSLTKTFSEISQDYRLLDFSNVFRSLGLLEFLLPLFLFLIFLKPKLNFKPLRKITLILFVSLFIWSLLVYRLYGISHGSNSNQILLFFLLGWTLLRLPRYVQNFFYYAQLLYFILIWALCKPLVLNNFNPLTLVLFIGLCAFYVALPFIKMRDLK